MQHGLFTYPWDLVDAGYDAALADIASAGFRTVNLATQYHAGKLFLPRNPKRRIYFQEDGAIFFQPDSSRYGRLKPRVHSLVTEGSSPLGETIDRGKRHGLDVTAWTVCLHNTWLGEQFPECCAHTPFGDPLLHSLSPAHPDVRAYLIALVSDLVSQHEVSAIQLESPGYMGFIHGFHHEILGVEFDPVQLDLLGLSFSEVELQRAADDGIEVRQMRPYIAMLLDSSWNQGVTLSRDGKPTLIADKVLTSPILHQYREWLIGQEISLIEEIREAVRAINPNVTIWNFASLDGSGRDRQLAAAGDGVLAGYPSSPADARQRAERAAALGKPVRGAIRGIAPDTTDPATIAPLIEAWTSAEVGGIDVYNYGLMPGTIWNAVKGGLRS